MKNVRVIIFEGGEEETAETIRQWTIVNEEVVGIFRMKKVLFLWIERDGGDDAVNVRMVLNLSAPGVKDGGEAEL